MSKKRGQTTTFIIIGLIIILFMSLYFYTTNRFEVYPQQINSANLKGRVELCLIQNTELALNELGQKNGYVFEHDFAQSIVQQNYKVDKDLIKDQLKKYLKQTIPECVDNLEYIRQEYNVDYGENIDLEIIYKEDSIIIELNYPIIISDVLGTEIMQISEFQTKIPVRLNHILELKQIIESDKNNFISNYLVTQINLPVKQKQQSSSDYEKSIIDFTAVQSKKILKNIKIENTDYEEDANTIIWIITDNIYPKTKVELNYNRLPLNYNAPGFSLKKGFNKKLLKYSDNLEKQAFNFDYMITVPVSVKITDELSFNGKNYEFNFVMPIDLDFSSSTQEIDTKDFTLEINSLESDLSFANIGIPKEIKNNEQVVIEIYNDDYYTVALYPDDTIIRLPEKSQEYKLKSLLYRDFKLAGGYISDIKLTDLSTTKLNLNIMKFTELSQSLVLSRLESGDYLNNVTYSFE
tara:strand:- start:4618 stop:6009 length:1392 start_codon:yes stop_codon:yes gene_type:complete